MDILNKKQKIILIIIIIFILLFIGYYIINKANDLEYIKLEPEESNNISNIIEENIYSYEETEENEIVIHVIGEVNNEGIVNIKEGSRISDAIDAAGGTTNSADLSKINLAYILHDGQKVYVPNINDDESIVTITEGAGTNIIKDNGDKDIKQSKININSATQTELETLTGIGPSTALKIINYRNENGNFKSIEDIKNVPGIGESKFENIKNNISI